MNGAIPRGMLLVGLVAAVLAAGGSAAQAAPVLGLEFSHSPESMPRTDRQFTYLVTVKNTASPNLVPGDEVTCDPTSHWSNAPTGYAYQWLRGGSPIAGAQSASYTVQVEDRGYAVQCEVTATNAGGSSVAASNPATVSPGPSPAAPAAGATGNRATVTGTAGVDGELTCTAPAGWGGVSSWTFVWLRNGSAAEAHGTVIQTTATTSKYKVAAGDIPGAIQCKVIGQSGTGVPPAGGTIAALSTNRLTSPRPSPGPPGNNASEAAVEHARPFFELPNRTDAPVTLHLDLPLGRDTRAFRIVDPTDTNRSRPPAGWSCSSTEPTGATPGSVTCTRSDSLSPGASYPKVAVLVSVGDDTPDPAIAVASVSGGGAPSDSEPDTFHFGPPVVFGIASFLAGAYDQLGNDETQAGGHPVSGQVKFDLDTLYVRPDASSDLDRFAPIESMRSVATDLPDGFVGNPQATPEQCASTELILADSFSDPSCPPTSIVGYVILGTAIGPYRFPLYATPPSRGRPAQFVFVHYAQGAVYTLFPRLRPGDGYAISIDAPSAPRRPAITGADVVLCGFGTTLAPENATSGGGVFVTGCKAPADPGANSVPLLTNPTACPGSPVVTRLSVDSWTHKGARLSDGSPDLTDPDWKSATAEAPAVTGCDQLPFEPSMSLVPTVNSVDTPTGLDVEMHFPQDGLLLADELATAHLKKAVVRLPEGMVINPGAANGLAACTDRQLRLGSNDPVSCPDQSKIGSASASTPLLKEKLTGAVYIRSQNSVDPESGQMFRLALMLKSDERGLLVKLPGQLRADPRTGRLRATFDNNPQLPVGDIELQFKSGPRAPLVTPKNCGTHTIGVDLTSWGGQAADLPSIFTLSQDGNGAPCSPQGFSPAFSAGSTASAAGADTSFTLRIARDSDTKELKAIRSVRLPEGLLGDVSSVPLCGEVQAATGTCPESSRVGHVQVAAGAGPSPLWVPQAGKEPTGVYLTGPYDGAPYGLSIKVPAQAGPFDLGRVVVRSALHVNERTAAITSGVDEARLIDPDGTVTEVLPEALPRILKGVVLNQREIRLIVDRENFMINPTDCSPKRISSELYSFEGDRADVGNRFTAVNCALLGFKPRFRARILNKGRRSTRRSWHPRTRFAVVPRKGDANIAGARVALPSSTILDQANIGTTCTRAQMAARDCPEASIVGYAKAWSPLLREAVQGPVYLAANGGVRPLPDLTAVLDGEIRVVLQGEISTLRTRGKARLQNTFRVVPDAPVSRFALTMRGGRNKGLLVNSTDLCRTRERGVAVFNGQNGRRHRLRLRIATRFKGCRKVRRQAARKAAKRKIVRKASARRAAAQRRT